MKNKHRALRRFFQPSSCDQSLCLITSSQIQTVFYLHCSRGVFFPGQEHLTVLCLSINISKLGVCTFSVPHLYVLPVSKSANDTLNPMKTFKSFLSLHTPPPVSDVYWLVWVKFCCRNSKKKKKKKRKDTTEVTPLLWFTTLVLWKPKVFKAHKSLSNYCDRAKET